jgi:hypothetical protein
VGQASEASQLKASSILRPLTNSATSTMVQTKAAFVYKKFTAKKTIDRETEGNLTHLKTPNSLIKQEMIFLINFLNKVNKTPYR